MCSHRCPTAKRAPMAVTVSPHMFLPKDVDQLCNRMLFSSEDSVWKCKNVPCASYKKKRECFKNNLQLRVFSLECVAWGKRRQTAEFGQLRSSGGR